MAKYRITGPDGQSYDVTAPDDASEQDVMSFARKNFSSTPQESPAPEKPTTGTLSAALQGAGQGLSFGFSDEIEGGARALYNKATGSQQSFSELYGTAVADSRRRLSDARETNPIAYYGGNIAGGVAVPGGLARMGVQGPLAAAAGRGLGARSVAAAKEGAAYGAAYGAGTAEGGIENRLTGAATGAGTGAALGAAVPGAIDILSSVGRGVTAPIRAAINPQRVAAEKVEEAFARDLSRVPNAAGNAGARLDERVATLGEITPSSRLMDAGGENIQGLMRAATNMPNQAREGARRALDARQSSQHTRLERAMDKSLAPGQRAESTIDSIIKSREEMAGPLFHQAFATPTPPTRALLTVMERPTMQKVGDKVLLRLQDEGKELLPKHSTEWMHRMKLELDDLIGQSMRAEKMGNTPQAGFDVRTLVTLKNDLLNAVSNPTYKQALRSYAGPSALKTAAERGMNEFTTSSPYQVRKALSKLSSSEQEMYRLGAKNALFQALERGGTNRDKGNAVFGSPAMMSRIRELFPSQKDYREFQMALIAESKMSASKRAIQGNSTTAKQLAEGDQAGKNSRLVMSAVNAATGRLEPVLNLLSQGYNRFSGLTPSVAAEITRLGMSKNAGAMNSELRAGIESAARVPGIRAGRSSRVLGGALPVSTSGMLMREDR